MSSKSREDEQKIREMDAVDSAQGDELIDV